MKRAIVKSVFIPAVVLLVLTALVCRSMGRRVILPFAPEQLKHAAEFEFSQGDFLTEARAFNSADSPKPPKNFRRGHVRPVRFLPGNIIRTQQGFALRFPGGGAIPTPTICNNTLFVSSGFNNRTFHAFDPTSGNHRWSVSLSDNGASTAACENGRVVFNTESCTIFALSEKTGGQAWSFYLGDPVLGAPAVSGGRVFTSYPSRNYAMHAMKVKRADMHLPHPSMRRAGSGRAPAPGPRGGRSYPTHVAAAFDLKTGRVLWQKWIDSEIMSSPVVAGNHVYATTFSGIVYKFDKKNGKILAARRMRASSAPVIANGRLLITKRSDSRFAPGVREALAVFQPDLKTRIFQSWGKSAPHLSRKNAIRRFRKVRRFGHGEVRSSRVGEVSVSSGDSSSESLSRTSSASTVYVVGGMPASAVAYVHLGLIRASGMQDFQGARALPHQGGYIVSMGGEVAALDATGAKIWGVSLRENWWSLSGPRASAPALAGNHVFVSTRDGRVLQIDAANGRLVRIHAVGEPLGSQPIIHQGRIYVGTRTGKLVAIDTKDRKLTGWTTWGKNSARNL